MIKRHRAGTSKGGQFRKRNRSEPGVMHLGDTSPDELADRAYDPCLTSDEARQLSDPEQPFRVRAAALRSGNPDAIKVLKKDPNPLIRYHAGVSDPEIAGMRQAWA